MTREEKLLESPTYLMYIEFLFHGGNLRELEQIRENTPKLTLEMVEKRLNQFFNELEEQRKQKEAQKQIKKSIREQKQKRFNQDYYKKF